MLNLPICLMRKDKKMLQLQPTGMNLIKGDLLYLDNLFQQLHYLIDQAIYLINTGKPMIWCKPTGNIFTQSDYVYFDNKVL